MSLNLPSLTRRALAAVFRLGQPVVRSGVFYRPTTFNQSTGWTVTAEVAAACKFIGAHVLSGGYLGLAPVAPGTENLLIRASELVGITAPGAGDYIVENTTALRRNVQASRLDPSGEFYVFQCMRSGDEDWGDLTAHTVTEDFGDLTAATAFEDRMALT
jgi:hypothetical protein